MSPIDGPLVLVVNTTKPGAPELADALATTAGEQGHEVRQVPAYPFPEDFLAGARLAVVIGGDGTLLSVVPHALAADVPLAGFNLGKLGFLTSFPVEQAAVALRGILAGDAGMEDRQVFALEDAAGNTARALNDIVLRSTSTQLATLVVHADNHLVNRYYADGLIFTTPTGSTAYNLSAGGPIVHPDAAVFGMTPICPHTLSNRSLIFDGQTRLRIDLIEPGADCLNLAIDGRSRADCTGLFPLSLGLSPQPLRLVHPRGFDFFDILRSKLRWGD